MALQNEGLQIWDASQGAHIEHSVPFLVFTTVDGPVMSDLASNLQSPTDPTRLRVDY